MRTSRHTTLVLGSLIVLVVAWFFWHIAHQEGAKIRMRYQQMTAAISAGDTNRVLALIAPQHRASFDELRFSRLKDFAKPLNPRSSVLVLGHEATVWPVRTSHYLLLPGGDTVEMIKSGDEWFFTGKVHID